MREKFKLLIDETVDIITESLDDYSDDDVLQEMAMNYILTAIEENTYELSKEIAKYVVLKSREYSAKDMEMNNSIHERSGFLMALDSNNLLENVYSNL